MRSEPIKLPEDGKVFADVGGIVVADAINGRVYRLSLQEARTVGDLRGLADLDRQDERLDEILLYETEKLGAVVVGLDGTVVVYDQSKSVLVRFSRDGSESTSDRLEHDDQKLSGPAESMTLVGATAVAHIPPVVAVWRDDRMGVEFHGDREFAAPFALQQPSLEAFRPSKSEQAAVVAVNSEGVAIAIALASGKPSPIGGADLSLNAPIVYGGCVFALAVEVEPPRKHIICSDSARDEELSGIANKKNLRLRLVNGWVLVSDPTNGASYWTWPDGETSIIDEWPDIEVEGDDQSGTGDATEVEQVVDNTADDAELEQADSERDEDGANADPVARPDQAGTRPGRAVVIPVLRNDDDPDGDVISVEEAGPVDPTEGVVSVAGNGLQVQFTPKSGFVGDVEFDYTISDGRGGLATSTVTVEVVNPDRSNRPPEATDDLVATSRTNAVSFNVLDNDSDPDGDSIFLADAFVDEGRVDFSAEGLVTYFPDAADPDSGVVGRGEVTVTYVVKDDRGEAAKGRMRVRLRSADSNQPPDARNDVVTVRVGRIARLNLLHNDSDPDGDPLRMSVRPTNRGVFVTDDGDLIFEAQQAETILDRYSITDGELVDEAQIRIEVLPQQTKNQPPVAVRDDVTIARGQTRLVRVIANDGDPDGDVIAIAEVRGIVDLGDEQPGFEVQQVGAEFLRITATPNAPDRWQFFYYVSDGKESVAAPVVLTVTSDPPANQSPVARPDALEVRAGLPAVVPVLFNDSDPDGDQLEIVAVAQVEGVDVQISDDGLGVRVLAPPDRRAGFTFTYDVSDGLNRAGATVKIRVIRPEEPNRPPVARPDEARTRPGRAVDVQVTLNDSDPDGDPVRVVSILQQGEGGVASLVAVESALPRDAEGAAPFDGQTLRYEPRPDFTGTDKIRYVLTDGELPAVGVLLVGVIGETENRPPTARDDPEGGAIVVEAGAAPEPLGVLRNDTDPDGDTIVVQRVESPDGLIGRVSFPGGTDVVYEAPDTIEGERSEVVFSYVITDGRGGTDRAKVNLTVVAQTRTEFLPPVARDAVTPAARPGTSIMFSVEDRVTDPDGDVALGSFAVDSPGVSLGGGNVRIPIPPMPEATGDDPVGDVENLVVRYVFTDEQGLQDDGLITVIVEADLPPILDVPQDLETGFGQSLGFDVLDVMAWASDPEGETLTGTCCSSSFHGSVTQVEQGEPGLLRVEFTPEPGFSGVGGFTFEVADPAGNTVQGTANIAIKPPENIPPSAADAEVAIEAGTTLPYNLEPLVDDPDGPSDELSVVEVRRAAGSEGIPFEHSGWSLELEADIAAAGSEAVLVYTVQDSEGDQAEGTLTVTVTETSKPPPEASNDSAVTDQGLEVDIPVTVNDIVYVEGGATIVEVGAADGGTAREKEDEPGVITFTPDPEFFGRTQFTYAIRDGAAGSGTTERRSRATVTVEVIGRPGQPPAPVVITASEQVVLTWGSPDANGSEILSYEVESEGGPVDGNNPSDAGAANSYTWTSLENGAEYRFRIRARNVAGWGPRSKWSKWVTPDVRPEAPGSPSVVFGDGEVEVSWVEPPNEGSPIVRYWVTVSGDGSDLRDSANTSLTWKGLTNGETYCFRVRAENGLGESDWSEASCETPAAPPAAPLPPEAIRGDEVVDLSWIPPEDNGDAIAEYEIKSSLGEVIRIPPESSYRWGDLRNAEKISFKVRATNKAGWGEWSPSSEVVTPAGEPDAPSRPSATANEDKRSTVEVTFPWHNGAPISELRINSNPAGGSGQRSFNVSNPPMGSTLRKAVESLDNGTSYTFRASVCNEVGCSEWSPPSEPVKPSGPPCRVNLLSAEPDEKLVTLGISIDPESEGMTSCDNGAGSFAYEMEVNGGPWQEVTESGGFIDFVANDNTDYSFRVRTRSDVGADVRTSVPATARSAHTPGPPCEPTLSASGGYLQASLTWIADQSCENGKPIIRFEIEYRTSGIAARSELRDDGDDRSAPIPDLPTHGIWEFRIRAENFEWGEWGAWHDAEVYREPCAPSVRAEGGIRRIVVHVSHVPNECDNLSDIIEYRISIDTPDGGIGLTVMPNDNSASRVVDDLDPGTYSVNAKARNKADWGEYSTLVTVKVIDVPCITTVRGSGGSGVASASWKADCDNNSSIIKYEVGIPAISDSPTETTSTSRSWRNLDAGTYEIMVRAINEAGEGPWGSDIVTVTSARTVLLAYAVGEMGLSGCTGECHRLHVTLRGFDFDNYRVSCFSSVGGPLFPLPDVGITNPYLINNFTSTLSRTISCWYAANLWGDIWVTVDGVESNRIRITG